MKKKFMPVFFLIVAGLLVFAVMPDFKESMKPVNRIINKGKKEGGAILIQFVQNDSQRSAADQAIAEFQAAPTVRLRAGVVNASESREFLSQYRISAPGYVILDGDGNPAVRQKGIVTADAIRQSAQGLHLH